MAEQSSSKTASQWLGIAAAGVVVAALGYAQEVLVPIALAILISFLLAPVVRWLERLRLWRVPAVLVTVALAFALLGGVAYVVYNQASDFSAHLPEYRTNIQNKIDSLRNGKGFFAHIENAGREVSTMLVSPKGGQSAGATSQPTTSPSDALPVVVTNPGAPQQRSAESPLSLASDVVRKLLGPAGTALLVVVLVIFMLLQREDLRDRFIRLMGRNRLTITTQALDEASERVSRYLLSEAIINGSEGVAVMVALWLIGHINHRAFPNPAVWGLLTFLLRFVPYVGVWIAAALPVLLSLAVYPHLAVAIETIGAYLLIELIVANAIEPFVLGANTGLAPLAVLVAATFWTWLWGPMGLLLSTPLTVCLVVIGRYVPQLEFLSILLGDEPALKPPARVYQRLLALDQEEAEELTHEYAEKMPIEQLYDEVLLPALAYAESDFRRQQMDAERLAFIRHGIADLVEQMGEQHRAKAATQAADATVKQARGQVPTPVPTPSDAVADAHGQPPAIVAPGQLIKLPTGCTINVACLPAHTEDDQIAAQMLAQLLQYRGYCAIISSAEQLTAEMVQMVQQQQIDLACISALPPAALAHARYVHKRLSDGCPTLPMVIGLWHYGGDLKHSQRRLGQREIPIATSLRQALQTIHQLVQPVLVEKMQQNEAAHIQQPATAQ